MEINFKKTASKIYTRAANKSSNPFALAKNIVGYVGTGGALPAVKIAKRGLQSTMVRGDRLQALKHKLGIQTSKPDSLNVKLYNLISGNTITPSTQIDATAGIPVIPDVVGDQQNQEIENLKSQQKKISLQIDQEKEQQKIWGVTGFVSALTVMYLLS